MKDKNGNGKQSEINALNKMEKIMKEELNYLDLDLTADFFNILKKKVIANNTKTVELTTASKVEYSVSHEAQVSFLIDYGIKLSEKNKDTVFLMDNYKCVEFYGVKYLIQINNYEESLQRVFDYLVENNSPEEEDFINQAG